MQKIKEPPKTLVLPIRFTPAQYQQLSALATLDQRTRCGMIRQLITSAARRAARRDQEGPR